MKKNKKPENAKTIADLKIVWIFKNQSMDAGYIEFNNSNPTLTKLKIKTNQNYHFLIDDSKFVFDSVQYFGPTDNVLIGIFIEAISWKMRMTTGKTGFKLDHFELVSENTFRIHSTPL